MRTIETKLYSFKELSKEGKENAITNYRNQQQQYGEYLYFFKENCEEQATEKGFIDSDIEYSLSYSQGDGLSFSAERYDNLENIFNEILGKGKENTAKILAENTKVSITGNNGRYCFASRGDIDLYIENYSSTINCVNIENIDIIISKALIKLEDIYIDFCTELEEQGYKELEYENSDEYLIEDFEENEYEFEENGTKY